MNGAIGTSWSIPISWPSVPPLATSVITPYAAPTESRFMIAAFSEISGEWNATSRSRNDRPTTPAMNSGMRSGDELALVLERRRHAADLRVDAGAAERLRHDVVADAVDQVRGRLVLRGALRDHGDDRGVARVVDARRCDERDLPVTAEPLRERVDLGLGGRIGQLRGDHQRAVGAGPEALRVEVVGLAGHRARRVVAGVGEAEAHAERGHGQREQDRGRGDRGSPRPPLDGVAPAVRRATRRHPPSACRRPISGSRSRSTFGPR